MPIVCGIRLPGSKKIYDFGPGEESDLNVGDEVIVETSRGVELGEVVIAPHEVEDGQVVGELKSVLRRATPADLEQASLYRSQEAQALQKAQEEVARLGLPMKVMSAEYSVDGSRLTLAFTAEERVDFRELVRELSRALQTHIEMRQVGPRDEVRILGGLGKCGRPLCCQTWLARFCPVSIRMAKDQDLPLSPMEISGICGRLMCCLAYEEDFYRDVKKRFPRPGKSIETPAGPAKVTKVSVLRETVTVLYDDGTEVEYTADQLAGLEPLPEPPCARGLFTGLEAASETVPTHEAAREQTPGPAPSTAPSRSRRRRKRSPASRPTSPNADRAAQAHSQDDPRAENMGGPGVQTGQVSSGKRKKRRRRSPRGDMQTSAEGRTSAQTERTSEAED